MEIKLKLKLLSDEPVLVGKEEYYDFYHKYVSPSIREIIENNTSINTIGLFGPWGSGKSTIVKNLEKECSGKFPVFVFDAWKYQSDPLKRTFLIKLFDFIEKKDLWIEGQKLEKDFLNDLYDSTSTQVTTPIVQTIKSGTKAKIAIFLNSVVKFITKNLFLIGIVLFFVSWLLLQLSLGEGNPIVHKGLQLVGYISQSSSFALLLAWIAKDVISKLVDRFLSSLESDVKTQTTIRKRDFLNSPEQFEAKFKDIISRLNKKTVIVFDNIDRVHGNVAIDILTAIKTFLEPEDQNNVLFIVPCDAVAITKQIQSYYSSVAVDTNEYLRKLFNVVIWTPEFIGSDLEDYARSLIKTLGDDSNLMNTDDVLLVINHAFKSNPREIKQFINNLVTSIIVVSKTEVWEKVKENIPYLAKVLVLRQKFPEAYERLKSSWYEPEKIVLRPEESELRNFMVNTSTITVVSAEPFLYFKNTNQSRSITEADLLATCLVRADSEQVDRILLKNKKNKDKFADYFIELYTRYKDQTDWLTNVFITLIESLTRCKIEIDQPRFYDRSLELIDRSLWQSFTKLPTDKVFDNFVNNAKAKVALRNQVIYRYVTALGSKEVVDNKRLATTIISNLLKKGVADPSSLQDFRRYIEEAYSTELSILPLFNTYDLQEKYITPQAIDKYLRTISHSNFAQTLPISFLYKKLINSNNIGSVLLQKLVEITQTEFVQFRAENPNKVVLYESIAELTKEPDSIFSTSDKANIGTLGNNAVAAFANSGSTIDQKHYFVPFLFIVRPQLDQTFITPLDNVVGSFIQTASKEIIENQLIPKLREMDLLENFLSTYESSIQERAVVLGGEALGSLFTDSNSDQQQKIIVAQINRRADLGLDFIKSLKNIPNRQEAVVTMLQRINTIPVVGRASYYEWAVQQVKLNDDVAIKQSVVAHVTSLLKVDSPLEEETGYKLLNGSMFLSETLRRDIAKDVLEWLSTSGKVITNNNRFALLAVSSTFDILQPVLRSSLISILFELLNKQLDKPSMDVALEVIMQLKPSWSEFKADFIDFKQKLEAWTDITNRDYVIDELATIAPNRQNKEQKKYWGDLLKLKGATI